MNHRAQRLWCVGSAYIFFRFSWAKQFHGVLLRVAVQMDIGKLVGKPKKTQRVMSINRCAIQVKPLFVCFVFEAESALIVRGR